MKIIKYQLCTRVNHGTEEEPLWENVLSDVEIRCTAENLQANEAIAKEEAYNGEYTIEDDGQSDLSISDSNSSIWDELDEAYQNGINSL